MVSGRTLNLASGICLGIPLAALLVGGWLADALEIGGAWWAILFFLVACAVVTRVGSRVDALLQKTPYG